MKWFNNFQIFWNLKNQILRLVHRKLFSFFSFPASLFLGLEIDEDIDRQGNFFVVFQNMANFEALPLNISPIIELLFWKSDNAQQ